MSEESSGQLAENPAEDDPQETGDAASPEINWENYYTRKMPEDASWWDDFSLGLAAFVFGVGCLLAIVYGFYQVVALVSEKQFVLALLAVPATILTAAMNYAFVILFLRVRIRIK